MADSFNGVTFHAYLQNAQLNMGARGAISWVPQWEQDPNVSERHIPYANRDLIQFGGRGNFKIVVRARFTNASDPVTMQGYIDGSPHTLVLYGTTYNNVYLIKAAKPEMIGIAGINEWAMELTFNRQGS